MNWSVTQIKTRVMLQLCCSWYYRKLLFSSCVGMCVREGKKWEHWAVTQPKFIPGWSETSLQSQHNQKLCEHRASPSLCWLSPSLGNAHLPNIPSLSPLSGFHFPSQDTKPELCIHNSSQRCKPSAPSPKVIMQSPRGENWCNTFPQHLKTHNRPLLAMDITSTEYTRAEM